MSDYDEEYASDFNSNYGSDVESDEDENDYEDDDDEEIDPVNTLGSQMRSMSFQTQSLRQVATKQAGPPLCVVCHKRPAYSKGGKSYPTCGMTCAAAYSSGSRGSSSTSSVSRAPSTKPSSNSGLMCVVCNKRPCYSKGSTTYVTCGLTCAGKLSTGGGDPSKCNYCHRKPKFQNYPQCGKTCRDRAKVACLLCRARPKNGRYHLCGKTCRDMSVKNTPLILEVPTGHVTFDMVVKRFNQAWKHPQSAPAPVIKKVYKIIENKAFTSPYDAYRKKHGNEKFCYHGTPRSCTLGNPGSTKLCTAPTCPVCNILRTSFKVSLSKATGAFGQGIYASTASNKAYSYAIEKPGGVMLLTKMVLGKVYPVTAFAQVKALPAGYGSVVFERMNGQLNETVVYDDAAVRPVFLIIF